MREADLVELSAAHGMLAELCRAEMPLGRALRASAGEAPAGPVRTAFDRLAREVEGGVPFAEAYRRASAEGLPPLYPALIEAGVAAGDLPRALADIGEHAALENETRGRLRLTAVGPVGGLLMIALTASAVALEIAVTRPDVNPFIDIFDGLSIELPGLTRFIVGSPWRWVALQLGLAGILGVIGLWIVRSVRPAESLPGPRRIADRLPLVGRIRVLGALAGGATTLALGLRGGLPLDRALDLAAASGPGAIEPSFRAMASAAREGLGLSAAAARVGIFPGPPGWLIAAAEARGEGRAALDDVARIYRERLGRAVQGAESAGGPLLQVVIAVLLVSVGLTLFAVVMPVLKLMGSLR